MPQELQNLVELPQSCWEAWTWFIRMHSKRSSGAFSVNPISYTEMQAFFSLHDIVPEKWELELISQWDGVALEVYAEDSKKETKKSKKK